MNAQVTTPEKTGAPVVENTTPTGQGIAPDEFKTPTGQGIVKPTGPPPGVRRALLMATPRNLENNGAAP